MKQVVGGETIYSIYDRAGTLVSRDNPGQGGVTDYVGVGGQTVLRKGIGITKYPMNDHLGTPMMVGEEDGSIPASQVFNYTHFGESVGGNDPGSANQQGYTGHVEDPTGLTYMQARYYDPVIGRFLSTDPVGYLDQLNLYAYVANDPINATDPTGEVKVSIGIDAELVVKLGVRGGINASFDTETLEVGASVTVGGRAGLSAGVGVSGSITESGAGAQNSIDAGVALNADANVGPVALGKEIVSASTRDGLQVLEGQSASATLQDLSPELKPQLKGGGSVGVDVTVQGTTSVIGDAVDFVVEKYSDFNDQQIEQQICQAEGCL